MLVTETFLKLTLEKNPQNKHKKYLVICYVCIWINDITRGTRLISFWPFRTLSYFVPFSFLYNLIRSVVNKMASSTMVPFGND